MPSQRLAVSAGLCLAVCANAFAALPAPIDPSTCLASALEAASAVATPVALPAYAPFAPDKGDATAPALAPAPQNRIADFALQLRHIRYRRGGRAPSTGFDCSGFVHYVFAQVLHVDLPDTSASQFKSGEKIARENMEAGDLVFFHTRGRRVSHVGIYLGGGRFVHAPASGQRVRVDSLHESYWAHRFVGARRPHVLA